MDSSHGHGAVPDLHQDLELEDFEMIRPLLFMAHLQQEEGMRTRKALKRIAQDRAREEAPTDFLAYQSMRTLETSWWLQQGGWICCFVIPTTSFARRRNSTLRLIVGPTEEGFNRIPAPAP